MALARSRWFLHVGSCLKGLISSSYGISLSDLSRLVQFPYKRRREPSRRLMNWWPTAQNAKCFCVNAIFVRREAKTSFFLGRETLVCTGKPGMARWHKHPFAAMSRHAQRPAELFFLKNL